MTIRIIFGLRDLGFDWKLAPAVQSHAMVDRTVLLSTYFVDILPPKTEMSRIFI